MGREARIIHRRALTDEAKTTIVNLFLSGGSTGDIAQHVGTVRARIEEALREAITGLAALNQHRQMVQEAAATQGIEGAAV